MTIQVSLYTQLDDFRTKIQLKNLQIGKHNWTYYCAGESQAEAILLLHGGGGTAEAMFRYIDGFSPHFRVIAPNIPTNIKNMDSVVADLLVLLQHEGIEQAHLIGISFGAAIAQIFIRRFQYIVLDMVIAHAVIPSDHLAEFIAMQRNMMRFYPSPLLLWFSRRAFQTTIANSITPTTPEHRSFWQGYFDGVYKKHITRKHILSRARLMLDYHRSNKFQSKDLTGRKGGDELIIQATADGGVSDGDRGALLGMYPRAYIQTLEDYDHLAPFLAGDEILSSMTNFLLRPDD